MDNFNSKCIFFGKPREQINEITSYIDASNIYGSTVKESDKLRLFKDGLLLTSPGRMLPPRADQTTCTITDQRDFCLLAVFVLKVFRTVLLHIVGDRRVQEVPTLASLHITFVRYHNHIARRLKSINPHWTDEHLFQETRKIIGAINQKITYEEYLPAILNKDYLRRYCLQPDCQFYDDRLDPATVNSFAVTAFRFGHSQIPGHTGLCKESQKRQYSCPYAAKRCPFKPVIQVNEYESVLVESTFKNPYMVFKDVDGIQLFQVTNASTKSDSLDLPALDIQRGRDHGIPSYTKFREFCGLTKVLYFHSGFKGLVDHDHNTVELLRKTYRDVEDIDLFVGGMTERPLPGSELGPTFSCIMARQFERYKIGDRFWWRRRDPVVGFTSGMVFSVYYYIFTTFWYHRGVHNRLNGSVFFHSLFSFFMVYAVLNINVQ
ncbi:hypothetical protein KUTeg_015930 [Tegillarca granosa]|uniref:Peroxidase n=1 Tax=Tegillarca granosa TaxID=220873 RepID=A0ABQ9EPQ6_TEGGR|nr:hypothetical protein KUTeg_015930 [Tegillarca granosa]